MIPILADSYPYTGNGLGGLSDAIECKVEHEVNGIYELSMRYPITGIHYDEILKNYFIMAEPDNMTQAQPFRIYRITKPLNGVVTIYARHIAYDMMGTIVEPFTETSLTAAILDLANHCTPATAFTFSTTRSVASPFKLSEPRELWRVLGGTAGSFLDVYGGEWDFNLQNAELKTRLGSDRGVHIRYGKNMTGLEQDATLESTYSGVWPFWYDADAGTLVQISEKFVAVAGAAVSDRVLLLDCTDDFETQPSEQDLRDQANEYITANSVGDPKLTWKVSFVQLAQAGEQAVLEQVMLGDTLHVYYEALGVNATARAVKVTYDVLAEHYSEVTVGRVKQNLASIIVGQNRETESKIASTKSALEQAIDRSTDFIKNGAGYMRMIYNSSNELVEIVSLDNPDISQAQNVWRWNNGGFGFSSTGYNGTYGLALTQAGEIVADYITAGTLNANVIRAGIIADTQGYNSWNLQTGAFTITNGSINITTNSQTYDAIKLAYNEFLAAMSPIQFAVENSSTKKSILVQAGGIYGYSDYTANPKVSGFYLTANGGLGLGGTAADGFIYLTSTNGNITTQIGNGAAYFGGTGVSGGVYVKNSSGTTNITLNGSNGHISTNGQFNALGGVMNSYLYLGGSSTYNGYLQITDSSDVARITLQPGSIDLKTGGGVSRLTLDAGAQAFIIKQANGTSYQAAYANDGIYFYNSSGTQTAFYPSGGLTATYPNPITSNVPNVTSTAVRSIQVPAGKYLLIANVAWSDSSSSTGVRQCCIGVASNNVNAGDAWDFRNATSAGTTRHSLSCYVEPSATTTYYLVCYQNSGSTMSLAAYGLWCIKLP